MFGFFKKTPTPPTKTRTFEDELEGDRAQTKEYQKFLADEPGINIMFNPEDKAKLTQDTLKCLLSNNNDPYNCDKRYEFFVYKLIQLYKNYNKSQQSQYNDEYLHYYQELKPEYKNRVQRAITSNIEKYNQAINAAKPLTNKQIFAGNYYSYNLDTDNLEIKNIFSYGEHETDTEKISNKVSENRRVIGRIKEEIDLAEPKSTGGQLNVKELNVETKIKVLEKIEKIDISQYKEVIELFSRIEFYLNSFERWKKTEEYTNYIQQLGKEIKRLRQQWLLNNHVEEVIKLGDVDVNSPCKKVIMRIPDITLGGEGGTEEFWYEYSNRNVKDIFLKDNEIKCVNKNTGEVFHGESYEQDIKKNYEYRWFPKTSSAGGKSRRAKKSRRKSLKKRRKTRRHTK